MDVAKKSLEIAKELGADAAEIFHGKTLVKIIWVEKDILKPRYLETEGLAFRVAKNGNIGFSYTLHLSEDHIRKTIKAAIRSAELKGRDPNYVGLPAAKSITSNYIREDIRDTSLEDLGKIYNDSWSLLKGNKKVTLIAGSSIYFEGHYRILNTEGIDSMLKGNAIIIALYALTREIPPNVVTELLVERKRDIKVEEIVERLLGKAERVLGCKEVNYSGKPEVILAPNALEPLLWIFIEQIMASRIKAGMSPFTKESLGQEVASKNVDIIDDPYSEKSKFIADVDFEGIPTRRKPLVKSGRLTTILNDFYHAKLFDLELSANTIRFAPNILDPVQVEPAISPWFITFEGKEKSLNDIISEVDRGFLVEQVMGAHQADPVSGKFSVPALAVYIENGELKHPIRNVMLSGTIGDVLKNVDVISKERELSGMGAVEAPYVRTSGIDASAVKAPLSYRIQMKIANLLLRLGVIKF
ncbi:MAG: TldD/PmbA family protein [Candidatus Korarchaeota archaeon]|nr:TldD/PmbA family protein [Thermoproteota archaeon]